MVYEVEFQADGIEYEYTIDGADGAVLEHETDYDD
ncbi:PepSY domain-containing protein [Intestinimonas butyriciproducens]